MDTPRIRGVHIQGTVQSFLKAIQGRDLSCFKNVRLTLDLFSPHDKHWDSTLEDVHCSPSELGFSRQQTGENE